MSRGTKTLLFGVHQFILHPFFVLYSWLMIYGKFPKLHELVAIVIHDWGLWGKPDVDGEKAEQHPEIVHDFIWKYIIPYNGDISTADIIIRWTTFWNNVACEVLGHSRYYAAKYNIPISKLCRADKGATALYPFWLYYLLGTLSGEINEYMERTKNGKYSGNMWNYENKIKWLIELRARMSLQSLEPNDNDLVKSAKKGFRNVDKNDY